MSAASDAVCYLAEQAEKFAAYARACEQRGQYEQAFDAIRRSWALGADARAVAEASGEADLAAAAVALLPGAIRD